MKILFICKANVGRSQIAEALYNKYTNSKDAFSAGTIAKEAGKKIGEHERTNFVLDVLDEEGIDIRKHKIKRLTKEFAKKFDKIIVMTDQESLPEYLKNNSKVKYWNIKDGKGKDYEFHKRIKEQIKQKVMQLKEG
jgi:protein-tyrosine phosphatase